MKFVIAPGGKFHLPKKTKPVDAGRHVGAEVYVSPRERDLTDREAEVRRVSHSIKHVTESNSDDFDVAASAMLKCVPKGAKLVPIPSSISDNGANRLLAERIASLCQSGGHEVCDVLKRESPSEPSHWRRKRGLPGNPVESHRFHVHGDVPDGPVVFVDNVGTTWSTANAAKGALGGRGWAVTYAKAKPELGEKEVEWGGDTAKSMLSRAGVDPSHGGVLHRNFEPEFRGGKMVMTHRWRVKRDADEADIRLVVPSTSSKMVDVGKSMGMKMVVPASGIQAGWLDRLKGVDAALESVVDSDKSGKLSMSVNEYLRIVRVRDWSWYSGMDACVSRDFRGGVGPGEIELRQAMTVSLYRELSKKAESRSFKVPAPVIQGWSLGDYVRMAKEMLEDDEVRFPRLVCIGSMCPRPIDGPNGLISIVEALSKLLPANVGFHILGLDSSMSSGVSIHQRVTSVDSMRSRALPDYPWRRPVIGPQSKYVDPTLVSHMSPHDKARDNVAMEYAHHVLGGDVDAQTGYMHFLSDASKSWSHAESDGLVHGEHYHDVNNPHGSLLYPLPRSNR